MRHCDICGRDYEGNFCPGGCNAPGNDSDSLSPSSKTPQYPPFPPDAIAPKSLKKKWKDWQIAGVVVICLAMLTSLAYTVADLIGQNMPEQGGAAVGVSQQAPSENLQSNAGGANPVSGETEEETTKEETSQGAGGEASSNHTLDQIISDVMADQMAKANAAVNSFAQAMQNQAGKATTATKPTKTATGSTAKDGEYAAGTYRVGTDLPPGEYELTAGQGNVYFVMMTAEKDGTAIQKNGTLSPGKSIRITLEKGSYLCFTAGILKKA